MQNILVVDGFQSILEGINNFIKEEKNNISIKLSDSYDDAYLQILKSKIDRFSFDVLITELTLETNELQHGVNFKIKSGYKLIELAKNQQPELNIIIFSLVSPKAKERLLLSTGRVDAYVVKGKKGLELLKQALEELKLSTPKIYISNHTPSLKFNRERLFDFDDHGQLIINCLSNGLTQREISNYFKSQDIEPNSLSSIEKKIRRLKTMFQANSIIELIRIYDEFNRE